jgi:N-acetyl-gamma-glutamyl-phosphate reductase
MTKRLVYVDGQEGTTGLRIHELLAARPDLEMLRIDPERRKDPQERARLLNAADVAFLCLPDTASREAAALVTNPSTCLIDASTAHRTAPGWVYGLPELAPGQREAIRTGKRISNPGCHATAFILLIRPLIDAGLISPTQGLSATSLTGHSGGGKSMIEQYRNDPDARLQAPRPYALSLSHKHLPEMMVHTGSRVAPVFMPVVGPFYKGLSVSVPLQLEGRTTGAALHQALATRYATEHFIQILPLGQASQLDEGFWDVQACNDTNRVDIAVQCQGDQVLLMARLDNLGKGASGAAVQAMNIHLGFDEGQGL